MKRKKMPPICEIICILTIYTLVLLAIILIIIRRLIGSSHDKTMHKVTCPVCKGSEKCQACDGTGEVDSGAADPNTGASIDIRCPNCNGTGDCFCVGMTPRELELMSFFLEFMDFINNSNPNWRLHIAIRQ